MLFFGLGIPVSALLADRFGQAKILIAASAFIFVFGLFFATWFIGGDIVLTTLFLIVGMFCMGLTYGPIGTALAAIFPVGVRYTGASLAFTLAGILGASLTPYIATELASHYGLSYVGYYLSAAAGLSLIAFVAAQPLLKQN